MAVRKLTASSIENNVWYKSMLAGNEAYSPSSFDLLQTTILNSSTASVTFSSLDTLAAGYAHLQIRVSIRSTDGNTLRLRFNSDSGNNYTQHAFQTSGGNPSASQSTSTDRIRAVFPAANTGNISNVFSAGIIDILDFSNVNKKTTVKTLNGNWEALNYNSILNFTSGLWNNTAAVTSMTFTIDSLNLDTNSRLSLYGIKA